MSGPKPRSPSGSHVPDPTPTLSPVSQVASVNENDPSTSLSLNDATMSPDTPSNGAGSGARRMRVLKVIVPSRSSSSSSSFRRYPNGRKPTRVYTLPRSIRVYPDEGESTVTIRNVEPAPTASPEFEVVRADDVIDITNSSNNNNTYSRQDPVEVIDKAVMRPNYGSSSLGFYDPSKVRYILQSAMDPPSEKYVYLKKDEEPDWMQRRESRGNQVLQYLPASVTQSDPGATPLWEARLDNDTEAVRPSSSASGRGGAGRVIIKETPVLNGFQNHGVILEESSSREGQAGSSERVKPMSEFETTSTRPTQSPVLRVEPHVSRIDPPQVARIEPPPSVVKTHEVLGTDADYAVGANYRADYHRDRYSLLTPHYDRSVDTFDPFEDRRDKYEAPPRVYCLQPVYHHNWVPSPRGPLPATILNSATLHELHKPRYESGSGARVIEVEGFYDTMCLNCHQCFYSCKRDMSDLQCSSVSTSSCCTVRRWTFAIGVLSLLVFLSLLITLLVTTGRFLGAKDVANTTVAYLVCGNVFLMAEITFAVLLLYGALKNSTSPVFAWIVWNIVAICLLFLVSGLVIILASSSSSVLSHMLYTPVVLFPRVLALVVVFSHYRRVKDEVHQETTDAAQPE